MIYAFDTFYFEGKAKTIGVGFESWTDEKPTIVFDEIRADIQEYESGSFYKRELPCILSLLDKIALKKGDLIIVDGFVLLSDDQKLGLGGYLYKALKGIYPIIGVAKNDFVGLNKLQRKVLRGESKKPLYITSLGIDLEEAAKDIKSMHGEFRMPTLLKIVDQLTRT